MEPATYEQEALESTGWKWREDNSRLYAYYKEGDDSDGYLDIIIEFELGTLYDAVEEVRYNYLEKNAADTLWRIMESSSSDDTILDDIHRLKALRNLRNTLFLRRIDVMA